MILVTGGIRMHQLAFVFLVLSELVICAKTIHSSNATLFSLKVLQDGIKSPPISSHHSCATTLPTGCVCSVSENASSITCSAVGLKAVPKYGIDTASSFVRTLNLERNDIREINIGDFFGVKIERLLLGNNSLHELNFLSFWGLEYSLETLDLSFNHFHRVPFEALRLLRNLRTLSLTSNDISALRDYDFGYMRKLEVLALDQNPIASIDLHSFVGTHLFLLILDQINLSRHLADLPTDDFQYVKGLSLGHNDINEIPPGCLRNLKSLRYLSLDDNGLSHIAADAFSGVEDSLRILELNHNSLTEVPSSALRRLPNLESLSLRHNKIRRLSRRSFNSSAALQMLDLSYNKLRKLSRRAFVGLEGIQTIDLRHNNLIMLDERTFTVFQAHVKGRVAVYIADNPWLCNCLFEWVKVEIDSKKHGNVPSIFADEPTCFRPPTLRDIPLSGVPSDEFTCDHDYYFYYEDNESAAVEDSI
jgi:Leucine-rich repeat (LRR) protein